MTSGQKMERNITCLLCQSYLSDPTTIPCGHNFCIKCITTHWDMEIHSGVYTCPQCKRTLIRRPSLSRNPALASMVQEVIQLRNKTPGNGHMTIQHVIADTKEQLKRQVKEREKELEKLRAAMISIEESAEAAVQDSEGIFEELLRTLEGKRDRHREHLRERMRTLLSQAEVEERQLIGHISILRRKDAELDSLLPPKEDNVHFLQKWKDINNTLQQAKPLVVTSNSQFFSFVKTDLNDFRAAVVVQCDDTLENIHQQSYGVHILQEPKVKPRTKLDGTEQKITATRPFNDSNKKHMINQVKEPTIITRDAESQAHVHKPKPLARSSSVLNPKIKPLLEKKAADNLITRQNLLRHGCSLSLNPETASPFLQLSDDNRKATGGEQRRRRQNLAKAFEHWEQVLCVEGLFGGRCYWEVEWRGKSVFIGVALEGLCRKGRGLECGLGRNASSWSLHCAGSQCKAWHNDIEHEITTEIISPRIGVFLDQMAGTLTFYSVSFNSLTILHTFTAQNLCHLIFPGFGVGKESSVKLCPLVV